MDDGDDLCFTLDLARLSELANWQELSVPSCQSTLVELLLADRNVPLIVDCCHDILPDLCARLVSGTSANERSPQENVATCCALSKLLLASPSLLGLVLIYFKSAPAPFSCLEDVDLEVVLSTTLRFLRCAEDVFVKLWQWNDCLHMMESSDPLISWYAIRICSVVYGMSDAKVHCIRQRLLPGSNEKIRVKLLFDMQQEEADLCQHESVEEESDEECDDDSPLPIEIQRMHLHELTACVGGVLLCRRNPSTDMGTCATHQLVQVESTCSTLAQIAEAVKGNRPVLLEGPVGVGKTSVVQHLAMALGNAKSLVSVQLSDQTDSKMLLGSYCCTDLPGQFIWRPGVLTQAVTEGSWIILEDIDTAPMSVISLLLPLLESSVLTLSGHSQSLKCAAGFQIFITRRCHGTSTASTLGAGLVEKLCAIVQVPQLTAEELKTVVDVSFPALTSISSRLVQIFHNLLEINSVSSLPSVLASGGALANRRQISLRDFMKWCKRLSQLADHLPSIATAGQDVFREALDCFCASISSPEMYSEVASRIGTLLGLTKSELEFTCETHQPVIQVAPTCVHIGRTTMVVKETTKAVTLASGLVRYHAYTRPTVILLEQLAGCAVNNEPVLLVGETGTGKTSTVQHLAEKTGHDLVVINLSQQTDSSDLLGGFKPVSLQHLIRPFKNDFEQLFRKSFSVKKNLSFLKHIQDCYSKENFDVLFQLMKRTIESAQLKQNAEGIQERWEDLSKRLTRLVTQLRRGAGAFVFAFVEGKLVDAVRNGHWLLLDEINLASPDTLECLISLMEPDGSILLMERGDLQPVQRHPEFRLFACMNPATDIGKRNLPVGVRNRFTELFVAELEKQADLEHLVHEYLRYVTVGHTRKYVAGVVSFYLAAKTEAEQKYTDGTGHRPHYSLRTLCRGLRLASRNLYGSMERSLFEGLLFSFLTQLERSWHPALAQLIRKHVLPKSEIALLTKHSLPKPESSGSDASFVQIEGYWIQTGPRELSTPENYVLTPAVKANLRDVARAVAADRPPVLLQGPTSVGKTSLIRYLATCTGHTCMRINNHEHTDLQEYLGSYVTGDNGQLVFQEGVLVTAMRHGHWIILDELNLAPTDVLEALNRVLDDNRELVIPETGHVVKAHPQFMLFATQNPAGQYGGRKMLSRALRNRFIELHFTEMPCEELKTILQTLCSIPPSYAAKMVAVMQDLQTMRRGSSVFEGKHGFITLRDLFRWAERYRRSPKFAQLYDWDLHLAEDGFLLLAGRVRRPDEELIIQGVLEKRFKRKISSNRLYGDWPARSTPDFTQMSLATGPLLQSAMEFAKTSPDLQHLVWTRPLRRLLVLAGRALEFDEPLLLVGETGCGKTTVCQLLAHLRKQRLLSVNCHMHSEAGDFLGGLRPVRLTPGENEPSKLFEWQDGPLVSAMLGGEAFLVDEISLADDSVLERLNSVLEPERALLLAEKSMSSDEQAKGVSVVVSAIEGFCFLATMNPGGDFGKKELSPALRNRFTEVWCPEADNPDDVCAIVECNITPGIKLDVDVAEDVSGFGRRIVEFLDWLSARHAKSLSISIRDLLSWISFINIFLRQAKEMGVATGLACAADAYIHGACLVLLDSLGSSQTGLSSALGSSQLRGNCLEFLRKQVAGAGSYSDASSQDIEATPEGLFGYHPFFIKQGPHVEPSIQFTLKAPTTSKNAQRLLRALQLPRPVLLEGSPGVGKTSLVSALAKGAGFQLTRINLSEQTDVTDLFGADLPVEDGRGGQFAWRDGPFLSALKNGHWIMLDELNLASQSVLEGLNACFDHRGEVFIPELGKSFQVQHGATRIFACQNPLQQGGGRKGLPKSFLNRFTQVYIEPLSADDLQFITTTVYPQFSAELLQKMILFNSKLQHAANVERSLGLSGGLWEFNLRDIFRWCDLMTTFQFESSYNPGQFVDLLYGQRMRSATERNKVYKLYLETFDYSPDLPLCHLGGLIQVTLEHVQVGQVVLTRSEERPPPCHIKVQDEDNAVLEALATAVEMKWMTILVGSSSARKTALVRTLAYCCGQKLVEMPVNSAMDTTELLGGFEQVDLRKKWLKLLASAECLSKRSACSAIVSATSSAGNSASPVLSDVIPVVHQLGTQLLSLKEMDTTELSAALLEETKIYLNLLESLVEMTNSDQDFARQLLGLFQLMAELESADVAASSSEAGCFKWEDSLLVTAARDGHWLLLENANFCSPSVLDRLNAMLEPGGVLTIDERGLEDSEVVSVKPHANFRLILSMDPRHGELSRAMRNRGVEMSLAEDTSPKGNGDMDTGECVDDSPPSLALPVAAMCTDSLLSNAVMESAIMQAFEVETEGAKENELFKMALEIYINQAGGNDLALRVEIVQLLLEPLDLCLEDFPALSNRIAALRDSSEVMRSLVASSESGQILMNVPSDVRRNAPLCRNFMATSLDKRHLVSSIVDVAERTNVQAGVSVEQEVERSHLDSVHSSILCQSAMAKKGPMQGASHRHEIVGLVLPLLQESRPCLLELLENSESGNNIERTLLDVLYWRKVFLSHVMSHGGLPVSYTEMHLMWTWFDQFGLPSLDTLSQSPDTQNLQHLIHEMRRLLPTTAPWSMGTEEWRRLVGHPPPLSSQEASECWLALWTAASSFSSLLDGGILALAASLGKLAELKEAWTSICELYLAVQLSLVISNPVAESLVVQCRDCQEKVSSVLTHCYAAAEDSGVTGTGTANQQLATSGLEVDMTSFALAFPFVRLCHQKIVLLTAQMACYHYVQSDPTEESRGEVPELLRQHIESFLQYAKHYPLLVPVNVVAVVETLSRLLSSSQNLESLSSRCGSLLSSLYTSAIQWFQKYYTTQLSETSLSSVVFTLFSHTESAMKFSVAVRGSQRKLELSLNAFSLAAQSNSNRFLKGLQSHLWTTAVHFQTSWWSQVKEELISRFVHVLSFLSAIPSVGVHNLLQSLAERLNEIGICLGRPGLLGSMLSRDVSDSSFTLPEGVLDIVSPLLASIVDQVSVCAHLWVSHPEEQASLSTVATCAGLISLLKLQLLVPQDRVDPAVRRALCKKHCEQMLATTNCELELHRSFDLMRFNRNSSSYSETCEKLGCDESGCIAVDCFVSAPVHERYLLSRMAVINEMATDSEQALAYRPPGDGYRSLVIVAENFSKTIANNDTVNSILSSLSMNSLQVSSDSERQCAVQSAENWLQSVRQFCSNLPSQFPQYDDVTGPCVAAAGELSEAVQWMLDHAKREFPSTSKDQQFVKVGLALCSFPLAPTATSPAAFLHAQALLAGGVLNNDLPSHIRTRLLVIAVSYIYLGSLNCGSVNEECRTLMQKAQEVTARLWWQVKEEERLKAEQEAALFKSKGQTHGESLKEVKEAQEQNLRDMFPTFDRDFSDLTGPARFEDAPVPDTGDDVPVHKSVSFNMRDMHQLCVLHEKLLKPLQGNAGCDDVQTMTKTLVIDGFTTACDLNEARQRTYGETTASDSRTCSVDDALRLPSLLVCHHTQSVLAKPAPVTKTKTSSIVVPCTQDKQDSYDIYHDPNPAEVQVAQPVLTLFLEAVEKLLGQWPEHPALLQLTEVIQRILSFPLQSSLMKILQGLELLLQKSQDWEAYASKSVSLQEHVDAVTDLILRWRRLELKFWPSILESCAHQVAAEASRWWMHMNQLLFAENASKDTDEIIEAIQGFIEASSVGQFPSRLRMIHTFYVQLVNSQDTSADTLSAVLWNAFHYYSQFSEEVSTWVQHRRGPLEKELRGFVRIARWNDANYWSIKQATEKTHRTLHSYCVKFKKMLSEPVSTILRNSSLLILSSDGSSQDKNAHAATDVHPRPVVFPQVKEDTTAAAVHDSLPQIVKRLPQLSGRIVKLQKRLWKHCPHLQWTESLNEFAGEIVSTVQRLQGLPVSGETPEERTKAFKRVLVQKRNALTSLFKASKKIGLLFRRGIRLAGKLREQSALTLPILSKPPDNQTAAGLAASEAWQGCHKYYMRSVARSMALDLALASPHKELTRVELDRCGGLSAHLSSLLQDQRSTTSQFATQLENVGSFLKVLNGLSECALESLTYSRVSDYCQHVESIKNLLDCCCKSLVDFQLLLECAPEDQSVDVSHITPLHSSSVPPLQRIGGRDAVQSAAALVQEWLSSLSEQKACVDEVFCNSQAIRNSVSPFAASLLAWCKRDVIAAAESRLLTLLTATESFVDQWTLGDNHGIVQPIASLKFLLRKSLPTFKSTSVLSSPVMSTSPLVHIDGENSFYSTLEEFATSLLLATQNLHNLWSESGAVDSNQPSSKLFTAGDDNVEDEEADVESQDPEEYDFEEGLLTIKSVQGLEKAMQCIDLDKLRHLCSQLLNLVSENVDGNQAPSDNMVAKLHALLTCRSALAAIVHSGQYLLVELLSLHRASCKLLCIVQGVFLELANKGFCRPAEVEFGDGKGAREFEDMEGTGLGEGQGMKDVSDEIETEDQLEDAHQKDKQEEEKADKGDDDTIKEEDNGIEMSEDFDGQLHDADDKSQEDDKDGSDDDEDSGDELDKQMGDIDGAGEQQLDERMWGSDSEDEDDDKNERGDEEELDGGEEVGEESKMVANVDVSEEGKRQRKDDKHGEEDGDDEKTENEETDVNEQVMEQEGDDSGDEVDDRADPLPEQPNDIPDNLDLPDDLTVDDADGDQDRESKDERQGDEEDMDCDEPEEESNMDSKEQDMPTPNPELESEDFESKNEEEKQEEDMDAEDATSENKSQQESVQTSGDAGEAMDGTNAETQTTSQTEAQGEESGSQSVNQQQVTDGREGHLSLDLAPSQSSQSNPNEQMRDQARRRRQRAQHDRTQMDDTANPAKRRKTTDSTLKADEEKTSPEQAEDADLYRHVHEDEEHGVQDVATYDAATTEESKHAANKDKTDLTKEEGVDESETADPVMEDDDDDSKDNKDKLAQLKQESVDQSRKQRKADGNATADGAEEQSDTEPMKQEQEDWERENKSFATASALEEGEIADPETVSRLRSELEQTLSNWSVKNVSDLSDGEAAQLWHQYEVVTSRHAQTLCEQLRLVLEPTMAAKLKGDYRTGKRLNMRKVVAYVASQFRKDRIWLRRTKPSKRQYQLLVAVDDSASMTDCHAKQMTFESLAVVTNALRWLEAGQVGICRFGQSVDLVHPLQETFSQECGARLLQNLTFQQRETSFSKLLTFATSLLTSARNQQSTSVSAMPCQLLIVLSDGRGVFREGKELVKKAVRTLIQHGIFVVFIVLDNVGNKDSVMDIQLPVFVPGGVPIVKRYMEDFPFPFYVVLRDINALADVLGSAMRQWFEMLSVEQQ